jgi:hypothetical protein
MAVSYNTSIVTNGLVLYVDAANKKSYSQNEFKYSTDIFAWTGASANAATLSRDTISSPVGNTPLKMSITGNDPHTPTYNSGVWNVAPAATGQTWVVSAYVKGSVASTGEFFIFGANSAGTGYVNGNWLAISAAGFNITTEWTRVSHYITMANADIRFIHVRLDGTPTDGAGQSIWWDGLQVERVPSGTTAPSPYNSHYFGGDVFKDLSGNRNDITLGSSVSFVNSFGGVLNFPQNANGFGRNTTMNLSASNYTVMAFVRKNSNGGSGRTITSYFNNWLLGHHDTTYGDYYAEGWVNDVGSPPSDTTWRLFTGTGNISLDSYSLYINDQLIVTNANGAAGPNGWNLNNQYDQYSDCQISNLICYNRVLTAAEVSQNFNALRNRFSL